MGKSAAREARDLVDDVERAGWRVDRSGAHYRLYSPDGTTIVIVAKTPSDYRWRQNTLAKLRRGGYEGR